MKAKQIIFLIIRIAVGLFFILSAVLKMFTIKEFEMYIYSYGILGYTLCTLFARILIVFEICAGLCLILKWWYRLTWWLMQISLLCFSIFLIFAQLRGDSNCNCMGDIVQMNPLQSMIKNVVLISLLFFVRNYENWKFKYDKIIKPISIFLITLVPFVVAPPEFIYKLLFSTDRNINTVLFEKALSDNTFYNCYPTIYPGEECDSTFVTHEKPLVLEGKNVVMFVHAGCKYCREGAKRLALFFNENELDRSRCKVFIYGHGNPKNIYDFIEKTESYGFEFREVDPYATIDIVSGEYPTFILMQDSSIVKSFDLWGLEESTIVNFFSDERK